MARLTVSPQAEHDAGVVSPYVVIYELEPDHVMVLRIVDGRRKITQRLVRQ